LIGAPMSPSDKRRIVDLLAAFADECGKLPAIDPFFLPRLERALSDVLEGRQRTIL
jgi:hypothetical protein